MVACKALTVRIPEARLRLAGEEMARVSAWIHKETSVLVVLSPVTSEWNDHHTSGRDLPRRKDLYLREHPVVVRRPENFPIPKRMGRV